MPSHTHWTCFMFLIFMPAYTVWGLKTVVSSTCLTVFMQLFPCLHPLPPLPPIAAPTASQFLPELVFTHYFFLITYDEILYFLSSQCDTKRHGQNWHRSPVTWLSVGFVALPVLLTPLVSGLSNRSVFLSHGHHHQSSANFVPFPGGTALTQSLVLFLLLLLLSRLLHRRPSLTTLLCVISDAMTSSRDE